MFILFELTQFISSNGNVSLMILIFKMYYYIILYIGCKTVLRVVSEILQKKVHYSRHKNE